MTTESALRQAAPPPPAAPAVAVEPQPGDSWFILRPGAHALDTVTIKEVTEQTIQFEPVAWATGGERVPRFGDLAVKFVERLTTLAAPAQPAPQRQEDASALLRQPTKPLTFATEAERQAAIQRGAEVMRSLKEPPTRAPSPQAQAQQGQGLTDEQLAQAMLEDGIERELRASTAAAPSPVPAGFKLLQDTTHAQRSWPEDASHENGNYSCCCCHCLRMFTAHKRRVVCKVCAAAPGAPTPAPKGAE
jgi:hypothetical protein